MIVKLPFMKQNGMIGVVQLDQVLQCAGGFFRCVFEVVDFRWWDLELRSFPKREDAREGEGELKHRVCLYCVVLPLRCPMGVGLF